jgi:hypothetical protein
MKYITLAALMLSASLLPSCREEEKTVACDTSFRDSLEARQMVLNERETSLREREIALLEREHAMGINNTPVFTANAASGAATPATGAAARTGADARPAQVISGARVPYKKSRSATAGQYPESTERAITPDDIAVLTPWGKKVMMNEIYARHGFIFQDADLQRHFSRESWYKGTQKSLSKLKLTPLEKQNIAFLSSH